MHNVQYSFVRLFHGRQYKKSVAIIRVQFSVAIGVVSEVELTSSMAGIWLEGDPGPGLAQAGDGMEAGGSEAGATQPRWI